MPRKFTGKNYESSLVLDGAAVKTGLDLTPNTNVSIASGTEEAPTIRTVQLDLAAFVVSLTSANDYGGTKLCDLPDTNMLILAVKLDCAVTLAGFASDVCTSHDFAVGTAVASSTALATTESDIIPATACVGAGATGTAKGDPTAAENDQFIVDGASNALYLNAEQAVTTGTATATYTGTVKVTYIDLGKNS